MKSGMNIVAPRPISAAYFINPSHQSVCMLRIPLSLVRNGSLKRYCGNEYTRNNRRIVGPVVLYATRVVSKEK
jgi:hypothetical protein